MPESDVIILGAGASGLYCAIHAARSGQSVTVLDHGQKPAMKVRVSGGGRCNFTNLETGPEDYLCANPHFCKSALARHTPWDVVAFFAECGLCYEEKAAGQLFCVEKAGKLAGELVDRAKKAGVEIVLNGSIDAVFGEGPFTVRFKGAEYSASKLVVALGAPSWPQAGASSLGFDIARQYGLKVIKPRPALVGFELSGPDAKLCRSLAGTALPARIETGGTVHLDDLLFTHKGISGPAPMQASLHWKPGAPLIVDFLPGQQLTELVENNRGPIKLGKLLEKHLPKRCVALLPDTLIRRPLAELSKEDATRAADLLHRRELLPRRTEGYAKAEVTAGGVDTDAISSKTFECGKVPGLYFIGEVLDVTGRLGGYNLQWAWASAHACAQALGED